MELYLNNLELLGSVPPIHPSIHPSMYLLAKCQNIMQITMQLTMLNGAPNRRGKPSVKILVLHNNTS